MDKKSFVIAIDGPVAAGKGTVASKLATSLNALYLYTGAMYRCLALLCVEKEVDMKNEAAVVSLLPELQIAYKQEKVFLNGKDVTERIKEDDAAAGSSVVGVYPQVREALVAKQQEIGKEALQEGKIVVIEGRDTGTKVFPDAALKIFLTATPEIRAQRRLDQYQNQGRTVAFEEVLEEIHVRDQRDSTRATDPLSTNPEAMGYFILDDSDLSEEETMQVIQKEIEKRGLL